MDGNVVRLARCSRMMDNLMCGELAVAYRGLNGTRYQEATKFALVCEEHLSAPITEFEAVEGKPTNYEWLPS